MDRRERYQNTGMAAAIISCVLMVISLLVAGPLFFLEQAVSLIVALAVTSVAAMAVVLFRDGRDQIAGSARRHKVGKWVIAVDCVPIVIILIALFLFPIASAVGA